MQSLKASRSELYLYKLEDAVEQAISFLFISFFANNLKYDIWDEDGDKDSEDYQSIYILTTDSEFKTVNGYEYRLLDSF